MDKLFQIPQEIMASTLEHHAKGEKAFITFSKVAVTMFKGISDIQFRAAFEMVRADAARIESFGQLEKEAKGYKVTSKLISILQDGAAHVKTYSIAEVKKGDKVVTESFTPKLTYILELTGEDTVTLKVIDGKIGKRSANGTVGSNSRISAFIAWGRGAKKGDTFKVVKVTNSEGKVTGYKVDGRAVASRGKGGLSAYILKMHPKSETTKILVSYGYSLD